MVFASLPWLECLALTCITKALWNCSKESDTTAAELDAMIHPVVLACKDRPVGLLDVLHHDAAAVRFACYFCRPSQKPNSTECC